MKWETLVRMAAILLWAAASWWDLAEQKIPLFLLIAMTMPALILLTGLARIESLFRLANACAVSGACAVGLKRQKTGAGDVWCLGLAALEVPAGRLPLVLTMAFSVMALVSGTAVVLKRYSKSCVHGKRAGTGVANTMKVPLVPFLLLGMIAAL